MGNIVFQLCTLRHQTLALDSNWIGIDCNLSKSRKFTSGVSTFRRVVYKTRFVLSSDAHLLACGIVGHCNNLAIAAFMSTISTHLNWGSSYVVNDFYLRFIRKEASGKEQVAVGRISTVVMMVFAGLLALVLEEARDGFNLLLAIGAGTGLLFILRWFWSRINPYSEIAAMAISFLIAAFFFINGKMESPIIDMAGHWQLVLSVAITTIGWVAITLMTKPSKEETLNSFNSLIFGNESKFKGFDRKILGFFAGVIGVYCALFTIGNFIYGKNTLATILLVVTLLCVGLVMKSFQTPVKK